MIPYIGGKNYLSGWIISNFPKNYQKMQYCEVFGGGGWVLFKKEESVLETYNYLNSQLVNLFRTIRDNYEEFSHRAEWSLHSREMYTEAKEKLKDDKFLNDVEKAMHSAIMRVQSFSGRGGWGYVVALDRTGSGKWLPFLKRLGAINARLKKVQIECLDFSVCINKYDTKNTLFYLDPPYVEVEHYYKTNEVNFGAVEHKKLSQVLKRIKGKFVLSYYDHPLVREFYSDYRILEKETAKHSAGITRHTKRVTKPRGHELLIMNY
ncbi:MAG: DNA adenine methylase [Ignavibacteriaceae bacterium]|nr:DNA adenine methylase [Ignavibacteriaceae bacterium]